MLFAGAAASAFAETPDPVASGEQTPVVISAPLDSPTGASSPDPAATEDPDAEYDDIDDTPDAETDDQSTLYVMFAAGGVALLAALVVLIKK
jgi:hypothetical protein